MSVRAQLDPESRKLDIRFEGPDGMDDPFEPTPYRDFLPPNVSSPQGEGYVHLRVTPRSDAPHGTTLTNQASIVFDEHLGGPTIPTPTVTNTIDSVGPGVTTLIIGEGEGTATATANWTADDSDSGPDRYEVYFATGASARTGRSEHGLDLLVF